jgi:cystathionine beta-lyase
MAKNIKTLLSHAGRNHAEHGIVNPAVYHASTVTFADVAALEKATANPFDGVYYGRHGTPTVFAFEEAVAALDGGYERAVATSSGLAAITITLLSYLKQGDELLMVDSVYGPTRGFCDTVLADMGVTTHYYDPDIGAGISALIKPNTRLIFMESPGSLTFEVQDVPAIVEAAKAHGVVTAIDNTWATPLFYRPIEQGVDIVIHAATKYLVGHADAMLGVICCADKGGFTQVKKTAVRLGNCPGPDSCYLGLRGLRTLSARLEQHQQHALQVANWLQQRSEVAEVWYPALPSSRGHELWQRDFDGASGLLGVLLKTTDAEALAAMLNGFEYFGLGYSWGGYESLALPTLGGVQRQVTGVPASQTLRLHIGLEAPEDLIADLNAGFERLNGVVQ